MVSLLWGVGAEPLLELLPYLTKAPPVGCTLLPDTGQTGPSGGRDTLWEGAWLRADVPGWGSRWWCQP